MELPPIPTWEKTHVLIVHFPVALLLVVPLLMVLGLLLQKKLPGFGVAAWVVLLLGTVAAWVAVSTGMATYNATLMPSDAAQAVADRHRDMGQNVQWIFTGLCAAYGVVLLVPAVFKRIKPVMWRTVGTLLVLAGYSVAMLYLANTAHQGGRLVHEFRITAADAQPPETEPAK